MTMHQRRRALRRIDLFLCKLFGIEPGPNLYPAAAQPVQHHGRSGFDARPAQRSSRRRS